MSGPADAHVPPPPPASGPVPPPTSLDGPVDAPPAARRLGPGAPPRTHWAVFAAGVVVLAAQVLLQEVVVGPAVPSWLFPLLTATYVLSLGLIVAGIVGWLLARYLTAMLPATAPDAAPAPASPEPDDGPVGELPTPVDREPAPTARRRRPEPTRITRPGPPTGASAADDDHSLWRP